MDRDIKILISCHKKVDTINNSILTPIALGVEKRGHIDGIQLNDNNGTDNISSSNEYFCEMTAMYYAYKNLKAQYYGFFHYRRYLSLAHFDSEATDINVKNLSPNFENGFGLDVQNIRKVLHVVDLIVPKPVKCRSVRKHFDLAHKHDKKDLDTCLAFIDKMYPSMINAAQEYLAGDKAYFRNMFIASHDIFMDYSNFVFSVLMDYHSNKDYSNSNTEQKRMPGFLAERLFGIYLTHIQSKYKNLKVLQAPIINIKNQQMLQQDIKIKQFYKTPTSQKLANTFLPRGAWSREVAKNMYIKLKGKP